MPRSDCRPSVLASTAVAVLILVPASVEAQTCMGTASLREGTGRIGVVAAHNERARSLGGSLSAGVVSGLFATASLSRLWIDVAQDPVPAFAATGGFALDIAWPPDILAFQVCPFAGYETVNGPNVDLGMGIPIVHVESHAYRGGLAIGGAVLTRASFALVPTGSVSFVREMATMRQAGATSDVSVDYGLLDGGLGVVFRRIFTVQAMASVPIRIRGLATTYGLSLGMNFGGPEY